MDIARRRRHTTPTGAAGPLLPKPSSNGTEHVLARGDFAILVSGTSCFLLGSINFVVWALVNIKQQACSYKSMFISCCVVLSYNVFLHTMSLHTMPLHKCLCIQCLWMQWSWQVARPCLSVADVGQKRGARRTNKGRHGENEGRGVVGTVRMIWMVCLCCCYWMMSLNDVVGW